MPTPLLVGLEGGPHIIVQDLSRDAAEVDERQHVASQERSLVHGGRKADEGLPRVAEDHDERVQLRLLAVDDLLAEFFPVDLGLEPWLGLEALYRRRLDSPTSLSDELLHDGFLAGIAHACDALEDEFAVIRGVLLQLVEDDLLERIQLAWPLRAFPRPGHLLHVVPDGALADAE